MEPKDQIFPNYQQTNQSSGIPPVVPQPSPTPVPKKKLSIFTINLIIFFVYYIIVLLGLQINESFIGGLMILYIFHAFILFILAIIRLIRKLPKDAAHFALAACAILIIGFGLCTATFFAGPLIGIDMF